MSALEQGRRTRRAPAAVRRAEAVELAASWVREGRRLDMQGLADELGVSRVTLFRHVGGREQLLCEALWLVTEATLRLAARRGQARRPDGGLHVVAVGEQVNALVSGSAALRRLLDEEPALTIRVLTDPRGQVQTGMVAFLADLIRRDVEEHGYRPPAPPDDLAYALVRLGESFLYADVLAARTPDVATANRLQRALLGDGRHPVG